MFLREFAPLVVADPNFTPERIRRFVSVQLPEMPKGPVGIIETARAISSMPKKPSARIVMQQWLKRRNLVQDAIRNAIGNSTDRMKKAFRALPIPHKWALIAMLEAGDRVSAASLREFYEKNCPVQNQEPFTEVMEDLTESFLKGMSGKNGPELVDWIHPSCKDLVIEELARQPQLRNAFLRVMSLAGIKIAISSAGGAEGKRVFPFLTSIQSWEFLQERCASVISAGSDDEIADLLRVLAEAHAKGPSENARRQVERSLGMACSDARRKWDRKGLSISTEGFAAYCEAGSRLPEMPDLPNVESSWREREDKFREKIQKSGNIFDLDVDDVCDWARFASAVIGINPRLIQGGAIGETYANEIAKLVRIAEKEIRDPADEARVSDPWTGDPGEFRWHSDLVSTLAKTFEYLTAISPGNRVKLQSMATDLKSRSSRLEDRANQMEAEPDDDGDDARTESSANFSVKSLFSDL